MISIRRLAAVALVLAAIACAPDAAPQAQTAQAQQPPSEQQEVFLPLDELPPQDQLPAAPLLVAAYAIVGLALFAYVVSVGRRLTTVQKEIERLESDIKRTGRT